jgi:hypothetical protein
MFSMNSHASWLDESSFMATSSSSVQDESDSAPSSSPLTAAAAAASDSAFPRVVPVRRSDRHQVRIQQIEHSDEIEVLEPTLSYASDAILSASGSTVDRFSRFQRALQSIKSREIMTGRTHHSGGSQAIPADEFHLYRLLCVLCDVPESHEPPSAGSQPAIDASAFNLLGHFASLDPIFQNRLEMMAVHVLNQTHLGQIRFLRKLSTPDTTQLKDVYQRREFSSSRFQNHPVHRLLTSKHFPVNSEHIFLK